MEGINLVYLALAAMVGGVLAALLGAWDAMAKGERWSWPKFGVSFIFALFAGSAYAGIGAALPVATDLWLAILTAVGWGAGLDVLSNRGISLVQNKSKVE